MDRLDKTDRAIIACLQYDGRMPFTTIARRLGISEATVRNRVARMRDDGTLQVVGVVDPHLLGLRSTAIVGIVVEPARLDSVARSLAAFEEVSYLVMTSGAFDLLVEVLCQDTEALANLLSERILLVEGVKRTETFCIFRNYKMTFRWGMSPEERERFPGNPV